MKRMPLLLIITLLLKSTFAQDIEMGLIGHWLMNNDEEVIDQSPSGLDGIVNGGVLVDDRFGNEEEALDFDGQIAYLVFEDAFNEVTSAENASFSISLWHKTADIIPNLSPLMCKYAHTGCGEVEREWALLIALDEGIRFYYASTPDNLNYRSISTLDPVAQELDTWYHIVVTYDGSIDDNDGQERVQIYVDNVPQADTLNFTIGELGPTIYDGDAPIGMMSYVDTNSDQCGSFNAPGALDDVRFYDRQLSPAEVTLLFEEGTVGISEENDFARSIDVFPTLISEGLLNIRSSQSLKNIRLEIISSTGSLVYQEQLAQLNSAHSFSISALAAGNYSLRLINENGLVALKQVVIE